LRAEARREGGSGRVPAAGGEAEAAEGHVGGGEEAAVAADVVGEVDGNVGCSRELAVHLEHAGGRGAVEGGERREEERGSDRSYGRRSHCWRLDGLIGSGRRLLFVPPPPSCLLDGSSSPAPPRGRGGV
jgi:hypothetical protein